MGKNHKSALLITVERSTLHNDRFYGEVQQEFNGFIALLREYVFFKSNNKQATQINKINSQQTLQASSKSKVNKQLEFQKKELDIAQKQNKINKSLFDAGIISKMELMNNDRDLLGKKQEYEQALLMLNNIESTSQELSAQSLDMSYNRRYNESELKVKYEVALEQLKSKIVWWYKNYLITTETQGIIQIDEKNIVSNTLKPGDEICKIILIGSERSGTMTVPFDRSSKIKVGQLVIIQASSFDVNEVGYLIGKVSEIGLLPDKDKKLKISVSLPNHLKTTLGVDLNKVIFINGSANIIAEKKSILQQLATNFLRIISR